MKNWSKYDGVLISCC